MFVKSKTNACSEGDNEILCSGCRACDGVMDLLSDLIQKLIPQFQIMHQKENPSLTKN